MRQQYQSMRLMPSQYSFDGMFVAYSRKPLPIPESDTELLSAPTRQISAMQPYRMTAPLAVWLWSRIVVPDSAEMLSRVTQVLKICISTKQSPNQSERIRNEKESHVDVWPLGLHVPS